jgi:hypothetical protein
MILLLLFIVSSMGAPQVSCPNDPNFHHVEFHALSFSQSLVSTEAGFAALQNSNCYLWHGEELPETDSHP